MKIKIYNINATNENEAVFYAKRFVATRGYWSGFSINKIMPMLKVESVKKS